MRLIALVDGSVYSRSVCDHAGWIASRTGAQVEIVHVLGRRETSSAGDLSGSIALGARSALLRELSELDEQRARLAQQKGRAILEDAQAALEQGGAGQVSVRLRTGDLVETVIEIEKSADLVLIGKRGEGADFAKMHLGSNLERIVRSARGPVFVANRAYRPIEKVLVAFDGGASSLKAVDHIARDPLFEGLDVTLIHAGEETAEARKKLDGAAATLKAGGHAPNSTIVPGQAEKAIGEVVEKEGIDLLVMGAYGHSRLRNLFIGSTTTEMIRSCKIPVLLFR